MEISVVKRALRVSVLWTHSFRQGPWNPHSYLLAPACPRVDRECANYAPTLEYIQEFAPEVPISDWLRLVKLAHGELRRKKYPTSSPKNSPILL